MFGIGGFELFIILVFGFLIFGPDKLPEIAKTVGKGIARFREAQQEVSDTIGNEKIVDLNNPDEPFKNPVEVLDRMAQRQEEKKAKAAKAAEPKAAEAKSKAAPAKAVESGSAPAGEAEAGKPADAPRQESFTERKARYERERAARRAAEAEGAEPQDLSRSGKGGDSSPSAQNDGEGQAQNDGEGLARNDGEGQVRNDGGAQARNAASEGGDA